MDMEEGTRWSAQAADLIQWFRQRRAELPATPFPLNAWTHVRGPSTLLRGLGAGYCPRTAEYSGGRARGGFGRPLRMVVEGACS